jgi:hypothetical protein
MQKHSSQLFTLSTDLAMMTVVATNSLQFKFSHHSLILSELALNHNESLE